MPTNPFEKRPEIPRSSDAPAGSSSQQTDTYQWYAQQSAEASWSNPAASDTQQYRDRLQALNREHKERSARFEQGGSSNTTLPVAHLDKRAREARYRMEAIREGNEVYEAFIDASNKFDQQQQQQIIREQITRFNEVESARQTEVDQQARMIELAQQAELARQAQTESLQPPELTPEQQASLALQQMGWEQPRYPGQGDSSRRY